MDISGPFGKWATARWSECWSEYIFRSKAIAVTTRCMAEFIICSGVCDPSHPCSPTSAALLLSFLFSFFFLITFIPAFFAPKYCNLLICFVVNKYCFQWSSYNIFEWTRLSFMVRSLTILPAHLFFNSILHNHFKLNILLLLEACDQDWKAWNYYNKKSTIFSWYTTLPNHNQNI